MARRKRGTPIHGLLLLDKPTGPSSNGALQHARRLLDAQKVGHTGTLDPLASGMLPLCFGEATKLSGYLLSATKAYETTLKLGVTTDSGDSDGTTTAERAVPEGLDVARVDAFCEAFRGPIQQVPPLVSALKVDGKRLYEYAREGLDVDIAPRPVVVHDLQVLGVDEAAASIDLSVRCSKGTYIRSLVHDLGEAIGCGAHVTRLRRTYVEPFEGEAMVKLAELEALDTPDERRQLLRPLDAGLGHLPVVELDEGAARAFRHGQQPPCPDVAIEEGEVAAGPWRVYAAGVAAPEHFLGLAERKSVDGSEKLVALRVMNWSV